MSRHQRIDGAAAFLLHSYAFSETSLVLETFVREHGRVAMLARGARRPRSAMRGVLHGFQPLELSWFGGGEVKTLARAEWLGGMAFPSGEGLLVGYYLNELLLKLLPREDAHPALFDAYAAALGGLARSAADTAELRRFEKTLLRELGYGLVLDRDVAGRPVEAERDYRYQIERGAVSAEDTESGQPVSGATLIALAEDNYDDARTLAESKQLMRYLIGHHLGGQSLQTRRVFIELQEG